MSVKLNVVALAAKQSYSLCRAWLPNGRLEAGREWIALNPTRDDKTLGSFKVHVSGSKAGYWADFGTGDTGKNMLSLYCYLNNINPSDKKSYADTVTKIKEMLGYEE